jgi:hypothetical protein
MQNGIHGPMGHHYDQKFHLRQPMANMGKFSNLSPKTIPRPRPCPPSPSLPPDYETGQPIYLFLYGLLGSNHPRSWNESSRTFSLPSTLPLPRDRPFSPTNHDHKHRWHPQRIQQVLGCLHEDSRGTMMASYPK